MLKNNLKLKVWWILCSWNWLKLIQTVISTTSSVSSKEDGLIFFVENEFTTNSKKNKSLSMINVIKLKKDGTTENYKVKYRYSKQTLTFEENIEYYHKTMVKLSPWKWRNCSFKKIKGFLLDASEMTMIIMGLKDVKQNAQRRLRINWMKFSKLSI